MRWGRYSFFIILAILTPSLAQAHGEWILFLPYGQIIALVVSGILCRLKAPRGKAFIVWLIAFGACIGTWALPVEIERWLVGNQFPPPEVRLFLIGFFPVLVVSALGIVITRKLAIGAGGRQ